MFSVSFFFAIIRTDKSPRAVLYGGPELTYKVVQIYDRDWLCVNKSQFVPVIFEPLCNFEEGPAKISDTSYGVRGTRKTRKRLCKE
jgi:hypothetical protein